MSADRTVLVVGSGPAGAQAARQALEEGFLVTMLDYGNDDPQTARLVPDQPFPVIRSTDPGQRRYLLDEDELDNVEEIRVGAHLTPPRRFITRDASRLLPYESASFQAMQSLALGGLSAGWGAGAYTFEDRELREAGLPTGEMRRYYDAVCADIGVSGAPEDDNAPYALQVGNLQPPLDLDTNASAILNTYERRRDRLRAANFVLGRAPVAALSRPADDPTRQPNPYFDMDFYGESRRSIYRSTYTIEQLRSNPRFRYVGGALVTHFDERGEGVSVFYRPGGGSAVERIDGAALLLAANAVNSARIALASLAPGGRVALLSNPYHYIPCVNLAMLGRAAADRRHSLAQLFGIQMPEHRSWERVTAAFYSYRSLLLYKLIKEMPLPAYLGWLTARALLTSFTIVGVHHPDRRTGNKWLELGRDGVLRGGYALDEHEQALVAKDLAGVKRALRLLRCIPLMTIDPGYGSSIHYAGTIPPDARSGALHTEADGRIGGTRAIYAADSSGWNYLPAKGLTFTIMANARRIAARACEALRSRSGV